MLLLASQSPRRQELLAIGGWRFRVVPAEVDERVNPGEHPRDYVLRLAEAKARAVAPLAQPGWLVLGADTAVVDGEEILGKPSDALEAASILQRLRGRRHQVYTALAILRDGLPGRDSDQTVIINEVCLTDVPMRTYSDEEIHAYVASGDPMDKAGAYAIQHAGFRPVESLEGCYANVMGLPLCHLVRALQRWHLAMPEDVPQACQTALSYDCPVYAPILRGEL